MAIHFNKIDQRKNLEEKIRNGHLSKELLQSLGVDESFSGLPLDHYSKGDSSVTISPKRGATISSLILDGKEIFYNNPQRRNDFSVTQREGLWMGPQVGNFSTEQMKEYGYDLAQHGFLRNVEREKEKYKNKIAYLFKSNPETFAKFPYRFDALQTIKLEEDSAEIGLQIKNTGENTMPFSPGHHTYYKVNPSQKNKIELDDNMQVTNEMKKKRLNKEETIMIPNPGSCKMYFPGMGTVEVKFDPKFGYLLLRGGDKDDNEGYLCIEPITDKASKRLQSAILTKPGDIMNIGYSVKLLSKDSGH